MWLIIGLIVGAAILGLAVWLRGKGLNLTWYEWLIGAIGLILLLFTIQNFFGSQAELESNAAMMFLLVTGLPALILLAVAWQLAARRSKS
jgi:uncharacterized membrane protein